MKQYTIADIAATEVESQHVITNSEPLPSTVDAEDVGKLMNILNSFVKVE